MSTDAPVLDDPATDEAFDDEALGEGFADDRRKMDLTVEVEDAGPCLKHVKVTVARAELDAALEEAVGEYADEAQVPGFRAGRVPVTLIKKRFKEELAGQVKQRVLIDSLEQVSEEQDLDPINEPDLDVSTLDLPDEGDFEYEFDVEVRPKFDMPDLSGLKIERPDAEVTDAEVAAYREEFLTQYGRLEPQERAAEAGDTLKLKVTFSHDGKELHVVPELKAKLKPILRLTDAELEGFDDLLAGANVGDVKEATLTVSPEAERVELRGEEVTGKFEVLSIAVLKLPTLTKELLDRIGVESSDELDEQIRGSLTRQREYRQRQDAREQLLSTMVESADWDLPEKLVRRQTENALRRELLEMQQAGFTTAQIRARENELKQNAVTSTRQALKEHFILDRVAEENDIEPTPGELDREITLMALQQGEPVRRVRSRLAKSGMIENLAAQLRERKAVDFLLENATYVDVPAKEAAADRVEAVKQSVCGIGSVASAADEDEDAGSSAEEE
ncbi:trigger factor [Alienimonas chondri]|uniref:Trigger factor n=1 Tax=Alienimonas chondri TaxID=2681879 RepID=A0ABX1V846_9PLAN|nr:trigger factor [Alienimonas chondri]NNJ24358.1 Trigger factor [Alienimonas chondri]